MNLAEKLIRLSWKELVLEEDIWKNMEQYLIEIAKEKASGCFVLFDISDKVTEDDIDMQNFKDILRDDGMRYYILSNLSNTNITSIMMWDKWCVQLIIGKNLRFKKVSGKLIRVIINKDESSNIKFKIKLEDVDKEAMSEFENYDFSYAC